MAQWIRMPGLNMTTDYLHVVLRHRQPMQRTLKAEKQAHARSGRIPAYVFQVCKDLNNYEQ